MSKSHHQTIEIEGLAWNPAQCGQIDSEWVDGLAERLEAGETLDPIVILGDEINDGHHRLVAHRRAGHTTINAIIVTNEEIEAWVAGHGLDEKMDAAGLSLGDFLID